MAENNYKYLHSNRTDPRFQTVTQSAPTLRGEVPEQKYGVSEADLTDVFRTAGAFINASERRSASQGAAKTDYIQRYKNTILSDYAAEDMKLVLQGQQNELDPSELALQRNLLKQQYLQVAPEYITQADFNKQAKANFNVDVGAELYKDELEMAQHKRIKEYDQLQENALQYMKEQFPDEYQSIAPSNYVSMMVNDMKQLNNLEETAAQAMLMNSNPNTTEEERVSRNSQVAASAEPVMESQMFKGLMDAWREIEDDGVVEDTEIEFFKSKMAEAFSSNYGYDSTTAYRQAGRITNRWLGSRNRSYNASVAANLKRTEDKKKLLTANREIMDELYATKVKFGINIGDEAGPAQALVFNRMSPGWLNKNGYDQTALLSSLFSNGTQALISQRIEEQGGVTDPFTTLGSGQYAAGLVDMLNDPSYLAHIPAEDVERYKDMSRTLAANYSKLFADFEHMTAPEVATYWFRPGQVMKATTNSITLPTVEETIEASKEEIEIPTQKRDNALIWNHRHDAFVKDKVYDSDEDRVEQQKQYGVNTKAMMLPYLSSIQDTGAIENTRYDPEKKQYYQVVPSSGTNVNSLLAPGFLSDLDMLNDKLKQPNLIYTDVDGKTQVDMRDEITEDLNKSFGILERTIEDSLNAGEKPYEYNRFVSGAQSIVTGLRNIEQGLEKDIKADFLGQDEAFVQAGTGTVQMVTGAAKTVYGGLADLGEGAFNVGAKYGTPIVKSIVDALSPKRSKKLEETIKEVSEDINYVTHNYDRFNPSITQAEFLTAPFEGNRSVNTMSIEEDGYEVLIPTVVDGKQLSDQEAIDEYNKTGRDFGKFTSVEEADKMAEALHNTGEALLAYVEARKSTTPGYGNIPYPEWSFTNPDQLKVFWDGKDWVLGADTDTRTAKDRYKRSNTYIFKSTSKEDVENAKKSIIKAAKRSRKDL